MPENATAKFLPRRNFLSRAKMVQMFTCATELYQNVRTQVP